MSLFRRFRASNLGQLVIEVVLVAVPVLLLVALLSLLPTSFQASVAGDVLLNVSVAGVIIGVFLLSLRRVERISLSEAGFSRPQWFRQLLLSFVCGGALNTVVLLILLVTGAYHLTASSPFAMVQFAFFVVASGLLTLLFIRSPKMGILHFVFLVFLAFSLFSSLVTLLILIAGAVQEELVFRGLLFRKLERSFGSWMAVIISAILFGIIHLLSPGATLVSVLAIMLTSGVLIAAIYILTRSLWWAIGIHLGWNFVEGAVFGTQVSGHSQAAFFSAVSTGPAAWTGGSFGPEAGLPCILLVGALGLFLCFRAARQQRMLPRTKASASPVQSESRPTEHPVHMSHP